jgi:preprotein translocase subunit SecF
MVVGVGLLGVGTLADLALVQLVGIVAGSVSSLLLATPLLVDLKMRDPKYRKQAERVAARRARQSAAGEGDTEIIDRSDDEAVARELRRERALAAAASSPHRTPSGKPRGKARPTGKRKR